MTDYTTRALSHLTSEFDGSVRLRGAVSSFAGAISDVSASFEDLKADRWVDTAIGQQLDGAGSIVGESRSGRNDDDYRRAIRYRIFANTTQATPSYVIRGLNFLTQPDDKQYIEMRPATVILYTDGMSVPSDISQAMQDIGPAAISDIPVIVSYGTDPLRFGRAVQDADFYVNENLLEVDGSTLSVSFAQVADDSTAALGGIVPSDLDLGDGSLLDIEGSTLAIYDPEAAVLYGTNMLPGVFA